MEQDEPAEGVGLLDMFLDPLGVVRRRWRWMLAVLIVCLAATAAFVATRKPRYAAEATLLVTAQQIREDLVRTTLEDDLLLRIDATAGEVLSRESLSELILQHDPYPELRESRGMSEIAARVREDIAFLPKQGLEARGPDASARLFTLRMEANQPEVAAAFVNDLAARLVNRSIEKRTQEAGLAVRFLARELERAEREMREQGRAIREFKEKHRGELPGELTANLARLDRLQQQRQSLALQIAEANTQLAALLSPAAATSVEESASPEARLAELVAELEEQEGLLTERHPEIQWRKRQIEALEETLGGSASDGTALPTRSGMIVAAQQTLDELRRQLALTEAELVDLDARVALTPSRQEELAALEEREGVLRENYRDFLRKVQEGELAASLESAQQGGRFSVLEEAVPPSAPMRSRWRSLTLGFVASLALAVGVGLLLESLDPVLVTARQVETESGLQILGSAPHLT